MFGAAVLGILVLPTGIKFFTKAQESEVIINLVAASTMMRNYFGEFKEYTSDPIKLGFKPESSGRVHLFFSTEELPPGYKKILGENHQPFASKSSYRIVGVLRQSDYATFWEVTSEHPEVVKLPVIYPE